MSIKKLQRYDIDEDGDLVSDSAYGYYCLTKDVTELEATNAELVKALEEILSLAAPLIYDHLDWTSEDHDSIIAARKALASARGDSHDT